MITPVHCRMLLPRHAWNVAATAKPCFLASSRAFWNIKTTRNSVTVTSTLQIKKQPGTRNANKMAVNVNTLQMMDPELIERFNRETFSVQRKTLTTSIRRHRANHTLHPGRFSAGQRLCKRFSMRNCKPRNSKNRRNHLNKTSQTDHRIGNPFAAAIKLSADKPSTQLRHKKRAAKRVCAVGAMRYSHIAAKPAIPVLTIKAIKNGSSFKAATSDPCNP